MKAIRNNAFLQKMNKRVHSRLGDNIYLIMAIMAVLLVFAGLAVGILGRGWGSAWFLVILGLAIGFFPCLGFVMKSDGKPEVEIEKPRAVTDGMESPMQRKLRMQREAEQKRAIELEALLARQQIRKKEEAKRREEELRRQEQRILWEARQREQQKLREEERKKQEKEKNERRRREEQGAKWNRGSQNVYHGSRSSKAQKKSQFFDGVQSYAELKKRYKENIKKYHPDNGGDIEVMHSIQKEYEELERFFKTIEKHNAKRR